MKAKWFRNRHCSKNLGHQTKFAKVGYSSAVVAIPRVNVYCPDIYIEFPL